MSDELQNEGTSKAEADVALVSKGRYRLDVYATAISPGPAEADPLRLTRSPGPACRAARCRRDPDLLQSPQPRPMDDRRPRFFSTLIPSRRWWLFSRMHCRRSLRRKRSTR